MEHRKGLLKSLTIQFAIVFVMAVLLHYVSKEAVIQFDIAEHKFPKSLAIALFLRLWVYTPAFIMDNFKAE